MCLWFKPAHDTPHIGSRWIKIKVLTGNMYTRSSTYFYFCLNAKQLLILIVYKTMFWPFCLYLRLWVCLDFFGGFFLFCFWVFWGGCCFYVGFLVCFLLLFWRMLIRFFLHRSFIKQSFFSQIFITNNNTMNVLISELTCL